MSKFIFFCLFALFASIVYAQNEDQQINSIKRSSNYIYATATSTVCENEASENAKELLSLEIQEWLKGKGEKDITGYVAKSHKNTAQIKTKKGRLFRVFAYVKKRDVLPFYKEEDAIVVEYSNENNSISVDSLVEETQSNSMTDETVSQEKDNEIDKNSIVESVASDITEIEKEMKKIDSFKTLQDFVKKGLEDKKIILCGKYATIPSKGLIYAFVYNKNGNIEAVIKRDNAKSVNIRTGLDDLIKNYSGCGAIWITINE